MNKLQFQLIAILHILLQQMHLHFMGFSCEFLNDYYVLLLLTFDYFVQFLKHCAVLLQ